MQRSKIIDGITLTLTIVGAINWGLVGLFGFNLVAFLFGEMSWLSRIIYIVIALCGLYLITFFTNCGGTCSDED